MNTHTHEHICRTLSVSWCATEWLALEGAPNVTYVPKLPPTCWSTSWIRQVTRFSWHERGERVRVHVGTREVRGLGLMLGGGFFMQTCVPGKHLDVTSYRIQMVHMVQERWLLGLVLVGNSCT